MSAVTQQKKRINMYHCFHGDYICCYALFGPCAYAHNTKELEGEMRKWSIQNTTRDNAVFPLNN